MTTRDHGAPRPMNVDLTNDLTDPDDPEDCRACGAACDAGKTACDFHQGFAVGWSWAMAQARAAMDTAYNAEQLLPGAREYFNPPKPDQLRLAIEARLTAEWFLRFGDTDPNAPDAAEWTAGEVLELGDIREFEVSVAPVWRARDDEAEWHRFPVQCPISGSPVHGWLWLAEASDVGDEFVVTEWHGRQPSIPDELLTLLRSEPAD